MKRNPWNRVKLYATLIYIFCIINFIFFTWNKFAKKPLIPIEISGYFFWLSLGLMLGFILCQYETGRVLDKER